MEKQIYSTDFKGYKNLDERIGTVLEYFVEDEKVLERLYPYLNENLKKLMDSDIYFTDHIEHSEGTLTVIKDKENLIFHWQDYDAYLQVNFFTRPFSPKLYFSLFYASPETFNRSDFESTANVEALQKI